MYPIGVDVTPPGFQSDKMVICSFPAIGFDWIPSLFLTMAREVAMANGRKAREYETYFPEN